MHRRQTVAEVPRSKSSTLADIIKARDLVDSATQENLDLARVTYLQHTCQCEMRWTMEALEHSPMFRLMVKELNTPELTFDPLTLSEFAAQLYLAGKASENLDRRDAGLFHNICRGTK